MSRTPVIGVTSSRGGGRYMWWFYWLSMRLLGMHPKRLVAPIDIDEANSLDGLIIGGGDDIGASLYQGEAKLDVRIDPERDSMELELLEKTTPRAIPVLGICRGAQMLNVFHGGSLHQDLYSVYVDYPRMWTPLPRKRVEFVEDSQIARLMRLASVRVNSLHTQAIDRLGARLRVAGRDEYGVIQAIEDPSADFRLGVQWHPEFLLYRRSQFRLISAFATTVRRRSAALQIPAVCPSDGSDVLRDERPGQRRAG